MTAADARSHLVELEAERAQAHVEGLGEVQTFMADLADEIDRWRRRYIAAALTEFTTLRAERSARFSR
jgi:hypothetical protein